MVRFKDLLDLLSSREFAQRFEICLIGFGVIALFSYLSPRTVVHAEYVGNVVTGFATSAGILAAFTGFWLAHLNSNASERTKKWLQKRTAFIVPFIGVCLFIVFSGLYQLVFGSIEFAVNLSALGIVFLILVDVEISYITFYQNFSKES